MSVDLALACCRRLPPMMPIAMPTVQVLFNRPENMQVQWDVGKGEFDSEPLVTPARYNFPQAASIA